MVREQKYDVDLLDYRVATLQQPEIGLQQNNALVRIRRTGLLQIRQSMPARNAANCSIASRRSRHRGGSAPRCRDRPADEARFRARRRG